MTRAMLRLAFVCLGLALCASVALAAANTPSFTAPAPAGDREDILVEGFEVSWPPAGWAEIFNHPNNWRRTNYTARTGQYSATASASGAPQDNWLVTPALDFSTAVNPKLEFWEEATEWSAGYHHYIAYSTTSQTDPAAFTMVTDWTPGNHVNQGWGGDPVTVSLAAAAGEPTVYIAFRFLGNVSTGDTWYVDDVRVYKPGAHDVAAVGTYPDGDQFDGDETITPQAIVENIGSTMETFDVQLDVDQSGAPIYSEVVTVTDMAPGALLNVDFPNLYIPAGEFFEITATTMLGTDGNNNNDVYVGGFDTYNIPHVPLGMLWTNSGCGPCVQANQALDAYMPGQGNDVALLRIHVWWPFPNDIMYLANIPQAQALTSEFNVSGVPDFWMDGDWYIGHTGTDMVNAFETAKTWKSPMDISMAWNDETERLTVTANLAAAVPPGMDLQLFSCITEDHIMHNGGNGEPMHMQAFRYMYPGTNAGHPIPSSPGNHAVVVDCPINYDPPYAWVYEELRASVYVRDMNSGKIIQAATDFLTNLADQTSADGPDAYPFTLGANYPNPFNPKTTISFSLDESGPATLRVYDAAGKLVRSLVDGVLDGGAHRAAWDGKDDGGSDLASGVYLYRLEAGGRSQMRKMLLLK